MHILDKMASHLYRYTKDSKIIEHTYPKILVIVLTATLVIVTLLNILFIYLLFPIFGHHIPSTFMFIFRELLQGFGIAFLYGAEKYGLTIMKDSFLHGIIVILFQSIFYSTIYSLWIFILKYLNGKAEETEKQKLC